MAYESPRSSTYTHGKQSATHLRFVTTCDRGVYRNGTDNVPQTYVCDAMDHTDTTTWTGISTKQEPLFCVWEIGTYPTVFTYIHVDFLPPALIGIFRIYVGHRWFTTRMTYRNLEDLDRELNIEGVRCIQSLPTVLEINSLQPCLVSSLKYIPEPISGSLR
jgi:hypothetical protein